MVKPETPAVCTWIITRDSRCWQLSLQTSAESVKVTYLAECTLVPTPLGIRLQREHVIVSSRA